MFYINSSKSAPFTKGVKSAAPEKSKANSVIYFYPHLRRGPFEHSREVNPRPSLLRMVDADGYGLLVTVEIDPANGRRCFDVNSLLLAKAAKRFVNVREMIRGHVLDKDALEFVVANAAV